MALNILLAPDKFKGSLTAAEVCDALAAGLIQQDATLVITKIPLADGGEGTCDLLTSLHDGKTIFVRVHDPLFREIESHYGISKDGSTAFIDMSLASGLQLIHREEQDPLITSTLGTGELIKHALDHGVSTLILGIGGSATHDAGMGAAQALGVRFLSNTGELLKPVGENLKAVHTIDRSQLHPRCNDVNMIILCDVDNPLYGEHGAAFTFARQKGADTQTVIELDEGMMHFAIRLKQTLDVDIDFKGAGAAGGIAVMMKAIMPTEIRSGIAYVMAQANLEQFIKQADVVITGEGKLDAQSLDGKVISGVAALCHKHGKPVFVIAGQNNLTGEERLAAGITHCFTLADEAGNIGEAIKNASPLLKTIAGERIFPILPRL